MKKILLLFTMLLMATNNFAIIINGINYELSQSNNKYTATVKNGVNYSGEMVIPSTVEFLGDTYQVVAIGGGAFSDCTELTNITIPESITIIEGYAFSYCTGLTTITIPISVTEIYDYAFKGCTELSSITIPNTIINFGYDVFSGCTSKISVHISNLTNWCMMQYRDASGNPSDFELYLDGVLVTDLVIPDGVTDIKNYAFSGCTSLVSVTIPDIVTTIGQGAFSGCINLTTINIPASISSMGQGAFFNCSSLRKVNISNLATWCNLKIEDFSTNPLSFAHNLYLQDELITDLVIPEGVTSIPDYAFQGCEGVRTISMPKSVTKIGKDAFFKCTGLLSVSLPESVKSIGENAFYGCTGLAEVSIPNTVTSIGQEAFAGCSGLAPVVIPQSVISIGTNAFSSVKNIVYSGTATDSPWGAKKVNNEVLFVEGCLTYSDETKEQLLACSTTATGKIIIPNTVTTIEKEAFDGCMGITSIIVPETVTSIGYNAFNDILNIKYTGTATGSPWGAKNKNKYVDGWLVYEDSTKIKLLGCCKNAKGEIIISDSVTTIGASAFANCTDISSVVIPNSVTTISGSAFYNCTNLTSITIPSSITSIGEQAFWNCNGLQAVYISDLTAWCSMNLGEINYCRNPLHFAHNLYLNGELVTDLVIPEGIKSIPNSSFYKCTSITSLTLPNTVTEIKSYAFSLCKNLKTINLPNSIKSIETYAFANCGNLVSVILPDSLTSIRMNTFSDCTSLTSVNIPTSVTSIGSSAFSGCKSLSSINIPKSLKSINEFSFLGCESLTSFEIPDSVTAIYRSAFSGCKGLTSIILPDTVNTIGTNAFSGCIGLTSVIIPKTVTSIGTDAFKNVKHIVYNGTAYGSPWGAKSVSSDYYKDGWFVYSDATKSQIMACLPEIAGDVIISDSVKSISNYAFRDCNNITSITIPNSVTSIGDYAFYKCTGLTSVTIPNSVTSIGINAFIGCDNLHTVFLNSDSIAGKTYTYTSTSENTLKKYFGEQVQKYIIGDSVTKIGTHAFHGCSNLLSVHIGNFVTTIGKQAFYSCKNLSSITIPNSVTTINVETFRDCDGLTSVNISNSVKSIQNSAFAFCSDLTLVTIGHSVDTISTKAFYSSKIKYIISYAPKPPICDNTSIFGNFKANLFVPQESLQAYSEANVWKNFKNILPITTAEGIFIDDSHCAFPSDTSATLAWQAIDGAIYYLIEIKENENIVNRYIIDGNGYILNSLRVPATNRIGATQSNNGWQYFISGLTPNTTYTYTITTFVSEGDNPTPIASSFTTSGTITDINNIGSPVNNSNKVLRNGQLLILHNGRTYTVTGAEVR